jgi:aspartate kinase
MSYEEMQEMAEAGARVLNAQAVEFAKEKGIAIYARATTGPLPGPDAAVDGTVIRRNPPRMPGTVVGVASERDVLVLEGDANPHALLAMLDEQHVAGKQLHVSTGAAHTTLVISRENLHNEDKVRSALNARFGDRVAFTEGLGAVSVIGAGINASYANVRAGLAALGEAGVEPRGMSTSSFRITWMVPDADVPESVRALHARFITAAAPLVP